MGMEGRRIRVLCVDNSALVRQILTELLGSDPGIEVVGSASDAFMAREKIKSLNPDVIMLDVEMPKMDGVTFLKNLMRLRHMPVVMVSSLTEHGAEITLDALSVGAVDYLPKPKIDLAATLADYREELIGKVKAAAGARVRAYESSATPRIVVQPKFSADAVLAKVAPTQFRTPDRIIAIGASTGGTEAIKDVLLGFPPDTPGVVIAQHIPPAFSTAFAKRMNRVCAMTVYEAEDGQQVLPGHVYIAPGDKHLLLVLNGARYVCKLDDGPPVNRHQPSVDVLFRSVAQQAGRNAIGAILTGMGKDGALGLKEMREAGSPTIAQDEATSVVWGMPGEATAIGAACEVLVALMARVTQQPPVMWGPAIVGFGVRRYPLPGGKQGEICAVGFSSRKGDISIYALSGDVAEDRFLSKLGKYRLAKGCLSVRRLSDVDTDALEGLVALAYATGQK